MRSNLRAGGGGGGWVNRRKNWNTNMGEKVTRKELVWERDTPSSQG